MNSEDLISKWSKETMEYGWVSIPSLLLFYQNELQINSLELNVIINLVLHWWEKDKNPYPSQGAIARRMGVSVRTVQRTLDDLVEKELLNQTIEAIYRVHFNRIEDVVQILGMTFNRQDFEKSFGITVQELNRRADEMMKSINNDQSDIKNIINKNKSKLDIDEILDKINQVGIENLTKEELEFLNNYNK